jgi:hypothetical protein
VACLEAAEEGAFFNKLKKLIKQKEQAFMPALFV